jgi:hypothetical protein
MKRVEEESIGDKGLLLKFPRECESELFFEFNIAGFNVRFIGLRLGSKIDLDVTRRNFVKVIYGEIEVSDSRRRALLREQRSLLVLEPVLSSTAKTTLLCVMSKAPSDGIEFIDNMSQVKIDIDGNDNLQWVNVSKYGWGPQFDNVEFYNFKGKFGRFRGGGGGGGRRGRHRPPPA